MSEMRASLIRVVARTASADDAWAVIDRWDRMERVVEAAREVADLGVDVWVGWQPRPETRTQIAEAENELVAALAELDGQTEPEAERAEGTLRGSGRGRRDAFDRPTTEGGRSGSVCPCRVHGDPDGDCGERCA